MALLALSLSACPGGAGIGETDNGMADLERRFASGGANTALCDEYVDLCARAVTLCLEPEHSQSFGSFCSGLVTRCRSTVDQHCRMPATDGGSDGGRWGDGGAANPPRDAGPIISDVAAINILERGATITWTLNEPATGQVDFGTTAMYGQKSKLEASFNYSAHTQVLLGLNPGTQYHYRVRSSNRAGVESSSADAVFKTDGGRSQADGGPVIFDVAAIDITASGATIGWELSERATGQVEYGTTTAYGKTSLKESSFAYSAHHQPLSGLDASTLYHFRVRSTNQASVETISGDYTFSTW